MGRPDLTAVRTAEILDAFERCVARFGLEGSSLEKVAEEAGMKRSILRHYVGNRDDLIEALADRVIAKYEDYWQAALAGLIDGGSAKQLVEYFFPDKPMETAESVLVVEALIGCAHQYPNIQAKMLSYVDGLVASTAKVIRSLFPHASATRCWDVAYGIVSICFNQESLCTLELPPKYLRAARSCAHNLLATLAAT